MEIDDHLTNLELGSHCDDATVDKPGNDETSPEGHNPESDVHNEESLARPPWSNNVHDRESFFFGIQRTRRHGPCDKINDFRDITKVRIEVRVF